MNAQIVTMSSKGQVALPVSLRREMGIDAGTKFVAFSSDDTIVLKLVKLPTADDFKHAMDEAQVWAQENGYSQSDINDIIKSVRAEKR